MCKLPGDRVRNSVKMNRKADMRRISKLIRGKVEVNYIPYIDFGERYHYWDMMCIPHNGDMTKNLHHNGTWRKLMYRRAKSLKT